MINGWSCFLTVVLGIVYSSARKTYKSVVKQFVNAMIRRNVGVRSDETVEDCVCWIILDATYMGIDADLTFSVSNG